MSGDESLVLPGKARGLPPKSPSAPTGRRRRVLVLVARDIENPTRAGGDRHVCLLAEYLAARGCDVTILCSSLGGLSRTSHRNGTTVRRIAPLRLLPLGIWAWLLFGAGRRADLVVEDMIGAARAPFLAPLFPSRCVLGFWFQDNSGFFDTHYSRTVAALAGAVQRVVLGVHASQFAVCPSVASREWLVARGYSAERTGVFYPSADPENLSNPHVPFSGRRNCFVTIGNIRRVKRFEEAIRALRLVRRSVSDAEVVILGRQDDGRYLDELRAEARETGLADCVSFEIGVTDQRKYDILSRAKVLTVHSATEGFALTVTEAGLCGVPTVSNSSVPPEAYRPGQTGVLVPEDSPQAFAREIVRLFRDEGRWHTLSKGALNLSSQFRVPQADPALTRMLTELRVA